MANDALSCRSAPSIAARARPTASAVRPGSCSSSTDEVGEQDAAGDRSGVGRGQQPFQPAQRVRAGGGPGAGQADVLGLDEGTQARVQSVHPVGVADGAALSTSSARGSSQAVSSPRASRSAMRTRSRGSAVAARASAIRSSPAIGPRCVSAAPSS